MMGVSIIEAKEISKSFKANKSLRQQLLTPFKTGKKLHVLEGVSFHVEPGEIVGIVGPNGAGKTTLLRILADLVKPDRGAVHILGEDLDQNHKALRKKIGYVPSDERSFFWRLSGYHNLDFFSRLYGLPPVDFRERVSVLLDEFGVARKSQELFRDYSTGTKKKFAIIRALLHQPRVVLLDEITNSLDPESAQKAKLIIRKYVSAQNGTAALWSTHRLEEIAEICDKVLLVKNGSVEAFDSLGSKPKDNQPSHRYLLQMRGLNGRLDEFMNYCTSITTFKYLTVQNMKEFIFENISAGDFGKILATAVQDFHAHILFAGCVQKNSDDPLFCEKRQIINVG